MCTILINKKYSENGKGRIRMKGSIGRIIVLLLLIIILALGGMLWFDYLGIMNTRGLFSPVYALFGLKTPSGITSKQSDRADIDADRYAKRLEALEVRSQELDKQNAEIIEKQKENEQISQELDDRLQAIEDKEKSYNMLIAEADDRNTNIKKVADYVSGMRPENAVPIFLNMDDQDIIAVFVMVDETAKKNNKNSMVPYWLSLMPPERAAEIQRKMANKPATIP